MAKWNIDAWIGNVVFGLAMVIIVIGFVLSLLSGGLFMYEYSSPAAGAAAALCIILLYVLFFINGFFCDLYSRDDFICPFEHDAIIAGNIRLTLTAVYD